jgi:ElaB/YqjD/DUF883 family membrane-anchored ribosome-binding protein
MNSPNPTADEPMTNRDSEGRESPMSGATYVHERDDAGLRRRAARVRERLGDATGRARERGAQVKETVTEYTGNHPFTSIALAFVAGMVLVAIARR